MTTKKLTVEDILAHVEPVDAAAADAFYATIPPPEEEEHPTTVYRHPEMAVPVPQEQP